MQAVSDVGVVGWEIESAAVDPNATKMFDGWDLSPRNQSRQGGRKVDRGSSRGD